MKCSTTPLTEGLAPGQLLVGYGKTEITPVNPVPLGGYGNSMKRISTNVKDPLFVTCIAMTDNADNTVLLFGIDVGSTGGVLRRYRVELAQELGLADDRVIFSASHTHSAPDHWLEENPAIAQYIVLLKKQLRAAAQIALEDRAPADLYIGDIQTQGLNFVRRYRLSDGRYVGYQSDVEEAGLPVTSHETEADRQLQLLKFKRDSKKDILLTNFQVHNHRGGGSQNKEVTSDIAGVLRSELEKTLDCHVIYITGAAGNLNPKSEIKEENIKADYKEHGAELAAYAMKAAETARKVNAGTIRSTVRVIQTPVDHSTDVLVPVAEAACDYFKECGSIGMTRAKFLSQGIHSPGHANMIISRSRKEKTWPFEIYAFAIGDVGFAVAPYEMFDTQGMFIKENSPYEMTVITGYATGAFGYLPSRFAFEHGGYEVDNTYYAPGTAEMMADTYVQMLKELYAEDSNTKNTL